MTQIKEQTLLTLYDFFGTWTKENKAGIRPVCKKGCDSCCTQNVTITAMEAERILHYIMDKGQEKWFASALANALEERGYHSSPTCTTNEFASYCFAEEDAPIEETMQMEPCPFLSDGLCRIYEVRPFGCRLFLSSICCSAKQPAVLPELYIDAATAANQLIEHLSQREYWGNMLDVLAALLDLREYSAIAEPLAEYDPGLSRTARMRTRSCQPLPGFIIGDENRSTVEDFLQRFFNMTIGQVAIEDILNGRQGA